MEFFRCLADPNVFTRGSFPPSPTAERIPVVADAPRRTLPIWTGVEKALCWDNLQATAVLNRICIRLVEREAGERECGFIFLSFLLLVENMPLCGPADTSTILITADQFSVFAVLFFTRSGHFFSALACDSLGSGHTNMECLIVNDECLGIVSSLVDCSDWPAST
jgi:hypothetical protein